jgi:hypothetical protein
MHFRWALQIPACIALCATPAWAQTTSDMILGEVFGLGSGFAAGLAVNLPPPPSAGERRAIEFPGVRAVIWRSARGSLPLSLEASGQSALRGISKILAESTQSGAIPNYGKPIAQTASSFRFRGPAEACDELLDLSYREGVLVSAQWTFCAE